MPHAKTGRGNHVFDCKICGQVVAYRKSLRRHYVTKHQSTLLPGSEVPVPLTQEEYQELVEPIRRNQGHYKKPTQWEQLQEQQRERAEERRRLEEALNRRSAKELAEELLAIREQEARAAPKDARNLTECERQVLEIDKIFTDFDKEYVRKPPLDNPRSRASTSSDSFGSFLEHDFGQNIDFDFNEINPLDFAAEFGPVATPPPTENWDLPPVLESPPKVTAYPRPKRSASASASRPPGGYGREDATLPPTLSRESEVRTSVPPTQKPSRCAPCTVTLTRCDVANEQWKIRGKRTVRFVDDEAPVTLRSSKKRRPTTQDEVVQTDPVNVTAGDTQTDVVDVTVGVTQTDFVHVTVGDTQTDFVDVATGDTQTDPTDVTAAGTQTEGPIVVDGGVQTDETGESSPSTFFQVIDGRVRVDYPWGIKPIDVIKAVTRYRGASAHDLYLAASQQLRGASQFRDAYLMANSAIEGRRELASELLATIQGVMNTRKNRSAGHVMLEIIQAELNRPLQPQGWSAFGYDDVPLGEMPDFSRAPTRRTNVPADDEEEEDVDDDEQPMDENDEPTREEPRPGPSGRRRTRAAWTDDERDDEEAHCVPASHVKTEPITDSDDD